MERIHSNAHKNINPCWILSTPRTGSSILCDMLNNLDLFEEFRHSLQNPFPSPLQKNRAFDEWLKIFIRYKGGLVEFEKTPPKFNKCPHDQYQNVLGNKSPSYLQEVLPGIKFLILKRRDLYAQTISSYFSKWTHKYHLYNEQSKKDWMNIEIPFDEEVAIQTYLRTKEWQKCWKDFSAPVEYYEDIINQPVKSLTRILHLWKIECKSEVITKSVEKSWSHQTRRSIPMTRPETKDYIDRLKKLLRSKVII